MNGSSPQRAAVMEDSSKVGRGGGQIISELIAKTLSESGFSVTLLDFGIASDIWDIHSSFNVILKSGGYRSQWLALLALRPNLVYCATKKAFLVGLLFKFFHPSTRLYFHVHNLSSPFLVDWTFAIASRFFCHKTLFPTEFTRRRFSPFQLSRQVVVGNPSDAPTVIESSQTCIRIGFVGRLNREKGFPTFETLQKKLSNSKLQFVAITQDQVSKERERDFPGMVFYTQVPRSSVQQKYDVLMVLSNVPETYSLSAVEAARAGKLVIANNHGAIGEVLESYDGLILIDSEIKAEEVLRRLDQGDLPHRYPPLRESRLVHDIKQFQHIVSDVLSDR